jgi:hypothetical protein
MRECSVGEIGKSAKITPAAGPGWLALPIYGCEIWLGDVQQDCDEGMVWEPHLSPI